MEDDLIPRRDFLQMTTSFGMLMLAQSLLPSYAWGEAASNAKVGVEPINNIDLTIGRVPLLLNGRKGSAVAMNGTVPGPAIRLREGQEAVIRVKNNLAEPTSVHWHGLILPQPMDGVPGVSFAGIMPGETFTYRFPVVQSGTYWCHSHSGGQEQQGLYAPLIIEPKKGESISADRDYIVMLSDWSFLEPMILLSKLKKRSGYFNYQRRTIGDFARDLKTHGFSPTLAERLQWMKMRMDPTDILDVTGEEYTYLMNGNSPEMNWTGLFKKGERVRLRFINAGAMTIFDVRVPGLKMTVVQADGQNVQPVSVDEFRFGPGETYDVIVEPSVDRAYAVFAESMDRSGYAIGSLSPKQGMKASVPERRQRPVRSMQDMGMSMAGMKMDAKDKMEMPGMDMSKGHEMPGMLMKNNKVSAIPGREPVRHGPDNHGPENSSTPEETKSRLHEPGTGLENNGRKVLVYTDLKSPTENPDLRTPGREIELHLTGNMERFMWSINGKKYSEDPEPILFHYAERVRLTLVNDSMMEHPMHLHGMFMDLENGSGSYLPRKHTVIVKPAERLSLAITADALGDWAFHCHMMFHMEAGMFRVVRVAKKESEVKS